MKQYNNADNKKDTDAQNTSNEKNESSSLYTAVNKVLTNGEKTVKNDKKTVSNSVKKAKKRADKGFIIAIALCVAIVIFITTIIALPEPIAAAIRLSEARDFAANDGITTLVINSPAESEGILGDKETVLKDEEAAELMKTIEGTLKNAKYKDTKKVETGIWKTKIVMYNATDKYTIYIDADGLYIENRGKLIKYSTPDNTLYTTVSTAN